ncbi:hypothetical protein QR685DRAFT_175109 [Neurospora intermedia]|uniref:Secreted protein n=1 Tax=Neurospora intermedia TaxID=5142 RepID=A0ABR3DLC2_NEUIN
MFCRSSFASAGALTLYTLLIRAHGCIAITYRATLSKPVSLQPGWVSAHFNLSKSHRGLVSPCSAYELLYNFKPRCLGVWGPGM